MYSKDVVLGCGLQIAELCQASGGSVLKQQVGMGMRHRQRAGHQSSNLSWAREVARS